ncbi:MAG: glycosyltransferase [candidate division KSB1 bacterium]|nr:glycosyltransferase [candidate division KSB1 bacterium]MDZ7285761.1 glycosyltransferase [candidate division KSB1 bacterium]MDZ7298793.1 glycosyltransferase [candidate division KSB1 bacterium]MDZ7307917.1 glycosyltransferase [candidate division KSB1 bacterium]MDZ7349658.1 glycosyltransferase [candidate division KSB1 bacterium]
MRKKSTPEPSTSPAADDKPHVLFIAYYFPPLGMAGTLRVAKWCKFLVRAGWRVSVVTVKPVAYYASDPSLLAELQGTTILRTGSLDPARVLHLLRGGAAPRRPPGGGRGALLYWFLLPDPRVLWLPFAWWRAWREVRRRGIRHVVTSGPPHSCHFVGWLLARFQKVLWVCDFRDTWLREEFHQAPTRLHRALQNFLERMILRSAHAVTAVSQGLAVQLQQTGGRPPGTTHFLPHGYDHEDFAAEVQRRDTRFQVSYVGALSQIQDPRPLLAGFRAFVDTAGLSPEKVRLRLVGADLTGCLPQWLAQTKLHEFVDRVGYVPHARAVAEMQAADLLVFLANPGTGATIIPSKTFEYLAARKPILLIGEKIEGVHFLLQHARSRHCDFHAYDAIARALLAFYKEFCAAATGMPPPAPLEFSRQHLAHRLAEILRSLEPRRASF